MPDLTRLRSPIAPEPQEPRISDQEIVQRLTLLGVFANRIMADRAITNSRTFINVFRELVADGINVEGALLFIDFYQRSIMLIRERYDNLPEGTPARRRNSI